MLGQAAGQRLYGKAYVSMLLSGKVPITSQVAKAARIPMAGAAGLDGDAWGDPLPTFGGRPVAQLKAAWDAGADRRELYIVTGIQMVHLVLTDPPPRFLEPTMDWLSIPMLPVSPPADLRHDIQDHTCIPAQ